MPFARFSLDYLVLLGLRFQGFCFLKGRLPYVLSELAMHVPKVTETWFFLSLSFLVGIVFFCCVGTWDFGFQVSQFSVEQLSFAPSP
jgi:hypothetical protein